ncbi:MAG: hypothetical protein JKY99_03690 [Rhizobiales bacterium]|nr:hypothetical protein [Hyphomicrobiales bacterium]
MSQTAPGSQYGRHFIAAHQAKRTRITLLFWLSCLFGLLAILINQSELDTRLAANLNPDARTASCGRQ